MSVPKHPSVRARRNKSSTRAVLSSDVSVVAPELPEHPGDGWHPLVVAWWADVWASPMAPEYDDSDRHGLFKLALLHDMFWCAEKPTARLAASAEIRLQEQRFGLSPIDRRRLEWEIERAEVAKSKPVKRREVSGQKADPRGVLRAL